MALSSVLSSLSLLSLSTVPLAVPLTLVLGLTLSIVIHRLILHELSAIPGPLALKVTSLPLLWRSYAGTEATYLTALFARINSPILRIGPNEVLLADGAVLAPIYTTNGGFPKAVCYKNFDIDGFPSLFSALDKAHRAPRAKSVLPLFSTGALRKSEENVRAVAERLVERLKAERRRGGRVDVLELARGVAVDVVSGSLFGTQYGGLKASTEGKDQVEGNSSASEFVNAFVGVGRFFFLPNWAFVLLEKIAGYLFETKEIVESFDSVQGFVDNLVALADVEDGTYHARMLKLGLSREEVAAQMKDLMFAGTDSSGMNLSSFCWELAKHPDVYAKVKAEVLQAKIEGPDYEPSALPYLRACLRETLRLSMANPTRLPRVVPEGGWVYTLPAGFSFTSQQETDAAKTGTQPRSQTSYFLPAGTLVSLQIHTLHHNPAVFPDPHTFKPERWLDSPPELLERMGRDHIPFGLGSRQCIARNLAMMELNMTCAALLESEVLDGATNVGDRIEILEWFNSKVRGEKIEIDFASCSG